MKKGVVILGGLILGLAFCVPAVAQPSSKAVETIVIDNFDTDAEWSWSVQSSRFVAEGYPILKKFEGIPNSLIPYHKDSDPAAMVLGVKTKYDRKGDNWFEVFPSKDDKAFEIPFVGTVTQVDFWVWGANYNYRLELLVRDADGRVHTLKAGNLMFSGWKNVVVNVPGYIRQHSRIRSGRTNMTFVGFRIRTDANEAVDDYVIYFDQLKYTTNTLSTVYDGYALKDADFGDPDTTSGNSETVQ
ncbi:flagellar filament outer layer protein FlaA [Treponema sp.]|uniref:flagellar filament outer layer protein FlaA n=1 Tax=Treponema sp. TaxID=166 RepID=UPI003F09FABE